MQHRPQWGVVPCALLVWASAHCHSHLYEAMCDVRCAVHGVGQRQLTIEATLPPSVAMTTTHSTRNCRTIDDVDWIASPPWRLSDVMNISAARVGAKGANRCLTTSFFTGCLQISPLSVTTWCH